MEAGKNVLTLFRARGWDAIITDDLVGNVIFLVSLITGGLTGCIGLAVEASTDYFSEAGGNAKAVSFGLGFIIGLLMCNIFLSSIASAVNAVIVLFAEVRKHNAYRSQCRFLFSR